MSDRRERIRKMLAELAKKIKAEVPQRKDDKIFQQALLDLRDSQEFEEIIAKASYLTFRPNFAKFARPGYELERAIARVMHGRRSLTRNCPADQFQRSWSL
jgi:hypothetical protein